MAIIRRQEHGVAQPISVTIVQPDRETWRFVCAFRAKEYSDDDVARPVSR